MGALTTPSARRAALRWLPTFLGFPAGGLVAKLVVGPVDSIGPALGGGAISGIALGLAQWIAVRRTLTAPEPWVLATTIGMTAGLGVGAAAVDYSTTATDLATQGTICGLLVGAAQTIVMRPHLGRWSLAWPPVLAGLWALGWTITTAIGVDVETQYTVFGSSGAVTVTALTSVLAVALDRRRTDPTTTHLNLEGVS